MGGYHGSTKLMWLENGTDQGIRLQNVR